MLSLADLPVVPPDDNEPARLEGSFEDQFFKPITTDFRRLFMNAIHKFERDSRAKGRRIAARNAVRCSGPRLSRRLPDRLPAHDLSLAKSF